MDTSGDPVPVEEVQACAYAFIPVTNFGGMNMQVSGGQTRSCKNAVRSPEQFCHLHGGNPDMSFGGKTVAKATAEAQRGELYPPSAAHWEQAELRYEMLQGQIASMMREDAPWLANMWAELAKQQNRDGTQRFSSGNQMLVFVQHLMDYKREHPDATNDELFAAASEKTRQPHLTTKAWGREDREPVDDATGVVVMHFKPQRWLERDPNETDEEWEERLRKNRGHLTAHVEYPLDQTDGAPYEQVEHPYDVIVPEGHGDAYNAYQSLRRYATERGYRIEEKDEWPGAHGYWDASQSKIVVWNGTGGGDPAAKLHVLAHEIGHADMGHSTDASAETSRPDKEAAAESFSYLVCARFGIDTSALSSDYVRGWQKDHGVNLDAMSGGAFMSAVKAADSLFLNVPTTTQNPAPASTTTTP